MLLPVVLIGPSTVRPVKHDAWDDVTPAFLAREEARILATEAKFDLAPAYLPYWVGRLFNETLRCSGPRAPRGGRGATVAKL